MSRLIMKKLITALLLSFSLPIAHALPTDGKPHHGIAMHGKPKYSADFTHFAYTNPDAPKAGSVTLGEFAAQTYDTFNPFVPKGVAATGVGLLYDSLTQKSLDEPFTQYGLIAEKTQLDTNNLWVIFHINPKATFSDGAPIKAEDVVFTFNTLLEKGKPFFKFYFQDVEKVEALNSQQVKFSFKHSNNLELPLILGELQILPKHYWKDKDFSKANLDIPLGSGPYLIKSFDPGRSVTYERNEGYWAKDLPVNKGRYNFNTIRYDYYRDSTIAQEAFMAGEYDYRRENTAKLWATAYTGKAINSGEIQQIAIPHKQPSGMQGFAFNTRRPLFKDPKVREALGYAFDFEWTNKQFMYNAYKRTQSYFDNSELAAKELPVNGELALLEPFRQQLPERLFTTPYKTPSTDGSGNNRSNLRHALALLKEAGWKIEGQQLVNKENQPFEFEILLLGPGLERHTQPFIQNLKKLGITANLRKLSDTQQYVERRRNFDFDMMTIGIGQSNSPGNEQINYWHSKSANQPDSANYAGVNDPVVDKLTEKIINAKSREELVDATKALDRVLLWGHYFIPHWYIDNNRIAYWDKFGIPQIHPSYGLDFMSWWIKPNNIEEKK